MRYFGSISRFERFVQSCNVVSSYTIWSDPDCTLKKVLSVSKPSSQSLHPWRTSAQHGLWTNDTPIRYTRVRYLSELTGIFWLAFLKWRTLFWQKKYSILKVSESLWYMLFLFQSKITLIWAWPIISDVGYFFLPIRARGPKATRGFSRFVLELLLVLHGNANIDVIWIP